MAKEMAKSYKPSEFEDKIYDFWLKGNYFQKLFPHRSGSG